MEGSVIPARLRLPYEEWRGHQCRLLKHLLDVLLAVVQAYAYLQTGIGTVLDVIEREVALQSRLKANPAVEIEGIAYLVAELYIVLL